MLYKFKSKAAGDVIMLESSGQQVLRAMGKEPAAKGIIEPAEIAVAIAALEAAIAAEEAVQRAQVDAGAPPASPQEAQVSLRQRAWPMIEMLKRAQAAKKEIVWNV